MARPTCVHLTSLRAAADIVDDQDALRNDMRKEDIEEPPLVGGKVGPADFEDSDVPDAVFDPTPPSSVQPKPAKKQADAVSVDEHSLLDESIISESLSSDRPASSDKPKPPAKIQDPMPNVSLVDDSKDDIKSKSPTMKKAEKSSEKTQTGVKMIPEQIEKAKIARAAATKAAEEKSKEKALRNKKLLANVENLLVKLGTRTKSFEIGEKARGNAEKFVEDKIKLGVKKDASSQDKLQAAGANAAKSVVATLTKTWEEKVVPTLREKLPDEFGTVTNKGFASATLGLVLAIFLFPALFSGGDKPKEAQRKKIDAETAMLEKKLNRDKSSFSSYSSRSKAQKDVFPPDENVGQSAKTSSSTKATGPPKVAEAPKTALPSVESVPSAQVAPSTPIPPPAPTLTPPPPKPVIKAPEPLKLADVTPSMVMSSVSKLLGPDAPLILAASFETLSPEPTVVLEVSKAYHRLPSIQQKKLAQLMLGGVRPLGYERVSLIEEGTGMEVAHAGIDIDLEDEAENLRAELMSLRKLSDKMAVKSANNDAEIDALRSRLEQEREEFAAKQTELGKSLKGLRAENNGLLQDLDEAKAEISKMPDRMALEERTIAAERKSEKLEDSVEMLSIQLSKARGDEARAKQVEAESLQAVKKANEEKSNALASVTREIDQAQKEAKANAEKEIAAVQSESRAAVETASKRVQEIEQKLATSERDAAKALDESKSMYEKQLVEEKSGREQEVQTIQSKYEKMLDDVQRKAYSELEAFQRDADKKLSASMKEASANLKSMMKERDQFAKEVEKSESRAQKAVSKVERERDGLQRRIEKLEAKLKGKETLTEESSSVATPEVASAPAAK